MKLISDDGNRNKVCFGEVERQGRAVKEAGDAGGALNFHQGQGGLHVPTCKDIRWGSTDI